jgi:type IV secretion system protein TrbI
VSDHGPPPSDSPDRSPAFLGSNPKRGRGVRRLNKIPVVFFVAIICVIVGAIGYTYREKLMQLSASSVRGGDNHAAEAADPAVLNEAPTTGEISSNRSFVTGAKQVTTRPFADTARSQPTDGGQQQDQSDDAASEARKQAWQNYYQQLAALQEQRQQDAASAMKSDTRPLGVDAGGLAPSGADTRLASVGVGMAGAPLQTEPGSAVIGGGVAGYGPGGLGGGFPALPPAGPDPSGAREKLFFAGQSGDLGVNDTLQATVRDPISPYLVTAGDVIPCVAEGGEDSDTPGQFVGRVSRPVYDSATGRFLLIPQNSKVIGTYDNVVTNGQTRIPTVITRIIFPDSSSIPIGAMPAADQSGFAGLHDQVNTHLWEKFGNALILAIGSAGIQLSQGTGQNTNGYNAQQIGAAAIGQQFGELGEEYARQGLSIPNTLRIRNGYNFAVQITKDMVLRPYVDRRTPGFQAAELGPVMQ